MNMMTVRTRLREATADIHEALHRAAPFAAIADGTVTRNSYGETLVMLHRYHRSLAPLCLAGAQALDAPELGAAHQARIARLEDDLDALEITPLHALPCEMAGPDFCAGVLYTVQGSTLGGKVIHRQLEGLLPDGAGRSFFKGVLDDGPNWQLLCARLEEPCRPVDRLVAGAQHGFRVFAGLLMPEG
jgi:heme oxygenase